MEKTKSLISSMFDVKSIFTTPNQPSFFVLILIFLISVVIVILNYYDAPAEAYTTLAAVIPIAAGIVNNLNKPGL